ncbi:hypothetical protein TNCV_1265491 [Trichonephila clavipes]|nr:hypothetical protein TNCV_1265491 [Trichonephila clavipes]
MNTGTFVRNDGKGRESITSGSCTCGRIVEHNIFKDNSSPTSYEKRNIENGYAAHRQMGKNEWPTTLDELDVFISILYDRGKGFAGAFKLCSTLNLPRLTKTAYKNQDAKLLKVVQEVAEESMIKAATEIVEKKQNLSSDIVNVAYRWMAHDSEEAIHL